MAEPHVISALRNERAGLTDVVSQLGRQRSHQRPDLTHRDATRRLFDPAIRVTEIRRRRHVRATSFRHGEGLRLIYDALSETGQPVTTRELIPAQTRRRLLHRPQADDKTFLRGLARHLRASLPNHIGITGMAAKPLDNPLR